MSDYFDRVERQIVQRVEEGMPRSTPRPSAGGYLAVLAAVLVVIVVTGVFLLARGGGGGGANPSPAAAAGARVVFSVSGGASPTIVGRSDEILRRRLHAAVPAAKVSVVGHQIAVTVAHAKAGARSQILALAAPGVLALYDWESEVLAPNGKTVASQLPSPSPAVMDISQGNGAAAAGTLGAGCVPLQQALALARKAGAGRPLRTETIGRLKLRVPVLYTVFEAAPAHPGGQTDGFFVARINQPVLSNLDITKPQASTDPNSRAADVTFGFTAAGRRGFEAMTKTVAKRGARVSSLGQTLNQHFAIALDNQLIEVPFVDFKQFPDGISADQGVELSGGFTAESARLTAILLRYGPLPVNLTAG